jgi:hypothetical protein
MGQTKANQERSKKFRRIRPSETQIQPSKAPNQDEMGAGLTGSAQLHRHQVDSDSDEQGISNRPVSEEHAFPDESKPAAASDDANSIETRPGQKGGNRGGV